MESGKNSILFYLAKSECINSNITSALKIPAFDEAAKAWELFSAITSNLSQELSEQLRLVLEPTQASRLKGDFRTGRRINMRKVNEIGVMNFIDDI